MEVKPKVCIIGAGLSGLCMAVKLKTELNLEKFTMFEICDQVGGTWFVNTYPGCECDIPTHLYSFSFAPNYDWSQTYASQPEILGYIKHVAETFGIYSHIRFQRRVETLRWNHESSKWRTTIRNLQTNQTQLEDFDIVVNASGKLRLPHYPKVFKSFEGPIAHSAEWNHTLGLAGKRVGVVGTAASGVQIVTALANKVDQLYIFQRKAPVILPKPQLKYSHMAKRAFAKFPGLVKLIRVIIFWILEMLYTITHFNSLFNKIGNKLAWLFRRSQINDPKLRQSTTPTYSFACKRIVLSGNYYSTLCQPNVQLVTNEVTDVCGNKVKTKDGREFQLDVLVLATGYQPHDYFAPMQVYGKDGVDVLAEWKKERPKGFMGIISHSMPNFFTLLGPYTMLGHSSNVFGIECQVHWSILAMKNMIKIGARSLTLKKEAEDKFMAYIDEKFRWTVWANDDCGAWYLDSKGQNTMLWPHHQISFWNWCKYFDNEMFEFRY